MLADEWEAVERCWQVLHLSTRNVLAAALDSLQALVSLFKVDTTDSVNIGSFRCQISEEQIYQSSLLSLTAELDLAFFAQLFQITNLHIKAKMDLVLFLKKGLHEHSKTRS